MVLSEDEVCLRMSALPARFGDRLTREDLEDLDRFLDVGEWLIALQTLVGLLRQRQAPITSRELAEFGRFRETFAQAPDPRGYLARQLRVLRDRADSLPLIPSLTEQEMVERVSALPETYADRLPERTLDWLTGLRDEKEWEHLAESMVSMLRAYQVPVTARERDRLAMVLDALNLPREDLSRLNGGTTGPNVADKANEALEVTPAEVG
ncbi:MafI family immunity protein [Nonomuraea sp. B10E15]|uniref:MafI family immunity protein n=1 Tax=Nonomuraea sp. B10E15 TaxID=3153560 RepID=UPI00325CF054